MSNLQHRLQWLEPAWPAPPQVHALSLLRSGGMSQGLFASLNPALHVGDEEADVRENRRRIRDFFSLPDEPLWLNQVHGIKVSDCSDTTPDPQADGSYARGFDRVCAVLTADCLPILLCDRGGQEVAALHAGWRGLAAGVIESALTLFHSPPEQLMACLGPAIGAGAFEVGEEVRELFCQQHEDQDLITESHREGHWFADLQGLARRRLERLGVSALFSMGGCTFTEKEDYFSFRRDQQCGRMATLIWLSDHPRVEASRIRVDDSGGGFYRCQAQ